MARLIVSKRLAAAVVVVGLSVLLIACGGGNGSTNDASDLSQSNPKVAAGTLQGLAPMVPDASNQQSAETSGQSAGTDLVPAASSSADRKVIQNASLELKVEDVPRAYQDAAQVALDEGGLVLDSSLSPSQDKPDATLTLRVPAATYEDALKKLAALAIHVDSQTSNAQDVTDQYTDLQARLRSAQAVEDRYLDLLNKANTIDDILKVQDRLAPVRTEIEQLQGQINVMDNLSANATIKVHLYSETPPAPSKGGPDPLSAAAAGWSSSLVFLKAIATGLLVTSAFLWWLAPMLVVAVGIAFVVTRSRRHET